ncbi:MAG: hypothetical protein HOL04_09180 [Gammaproteobacteria bacterium]|jgi:hypothetical protein|nr:hypothetical protein [Gammaproteobacteria bacterium]MBT4607340.1 hypothetical protein [Thiotrichales bacterium]MBT3472960.1 hypothetical protein [Gammaproteobacteria bacterium]MBT3968396.1 hypothetical protein [Gammaproteobacteria bacterium]MBT4080353.1 hypothetical protein [Gammaproteobacteria bacterium]
MIYSPDNREVFVDYSLVPANPNAEQAIQIIFNELSQTNAYRKSDRRKFKAAALPLIADLLSNPNRWHIYSRNNSGAPQSSQYLPYPISNLFVIRAVDALIESKLINHEMGWKDRNTGLGRKSVFQATSKVATLLTGLQPEFKSIPPDVVVLNEPGEWGHGRKFKGKAIAYSDNRLTRDERNFLTKYNQLLSKTEITETIYTPEGIQQIRHHTSLRRIFSGDWNHGGRYYCFHGGYQTFKGYRRRQLLIEGMPVCEIDYSAHHLRLCYALDGLDYGAIHGAGDDPYMLPGMDRSLRFITKKIVLIAINHTNPVGAIKTIESTLIDKHGEDVLNGINIASIYDQFMIKHRHIEHWFCSDAGSRLQRIDSDIMRYILEQCYQLGIVALPVHDSVVVNQHERLQVIQIMNDAYRLVINSDAVLDEKFNFLPHSATERREGRLYYIGNQSKPEPKRAGLRTLTRVADYPFTINNITFPEIRH